MTEERKEDNRRSFMGISRPSEALKAMCDGLEEASRRGDFKVSMGTFGDFSGTTCYGCAATCALQKLSGRNFPPDEIWNMQQRAGFLRLGELELVEFEFSVDNARKGNLGDLFEFFGFHPKEAEPHNGRWVLWTEDWREHIPTVREEAARMALRGY